MLETRDIGARRLQFDQDRFVFHPDVDAAMPVNVSAELPVLFRLDRKADAREDARQQNETANHEDPPPAIAV
jgi:hypothetical protein